MTHLEKIQFTATGHRTLGRLDQHALVSIITIVVMALAVPTYAQSVPATETNSSAVSAEDETIRPFRINIPEQALVDLRGRIAATKWPARETVADATQGVQLATMRELARYWQTDYDWRKVEARLNALPQFTTNIDGLDIHFIHVRSKNPNALAVIITHGWPGSVIEQLKIIDPLTDPTPMVRVHRTLSTS